MDREIQQKNSLSSNRIKLKIGGGRNIREEGVDLFTDREKSRRKLLISKTRNEKNI